MIMAKIFKLIRTDVADVGSWCEMVVVATSESKARIIHPDADDMNIIRFSAVLNRWEQKTNDGKWVPYPNTRWVHPDNLKIELVGTSKMKSGTVILKSYL